MTTPTLRSLFDDLHAERVRTWKPEDLQPNIDQRRKLVEEAPRRRFVKAGDRVEAFRLPEVDGGEVVLSDLLRRGPVVLVFFRFAGCPACNIALPYYASELHPGLEAAGATLVAVSPQVPERLVEIKRRHDLPFPVASDAGNGLARAFDLAFTTDGADKQRKLAELIGGPNGDLPMPAVVVIAPDRCVAFADVTPDWLARTEAEPVLAAVRQLAAVPAL